MISFIVPAYNEEALLGATLEAIRDAGQALGEEFEIVVADDASTDRTAEIAQTRGARVVTEHHRQIAATRNAGARAARGDIFIFVDADTIVNPAVVQAAVAALREGTLGGGARVSLTGPLPTWSRWIAPALARFYPLTGWAAGCFMYCSRPAFEAVGGFDERLFGAEEIAFSRALKRQGRFHILQESVLTSARKLRLYSGREHLRLLGKAIRYGRATVQNRENMPMWYDGRREPGP